MGKSGESRRDGLAVRAYDPVGRGVCEVFISHQRMITVGKRSLAHASECAYIVPVILQAPTAVFEGLRRDEDDDPHGVGWRCYCGFVNDESVAYNWRWEEADPEDPTLLLDRENRFRQRLL
jgi:hypothetical protein